MDKSQLKIFRMRIENCSSLEQVNIVEESFKLNKRIPVVLRPQIEGMILAKKKRYKTTKQSVKETINNKVENRVNLFFGILGHLPTCKMIDIATERLLIDIVKITGVDNSNADGYVKNLLQRVTRKANKKKETILNLNANKKKEKLSNSKIKADRKENKENKDNKDNQIKLLTGKENLNDTWTNHSADHSTSIGHKVAQEPAPLRQNEGEQLNDTIRKNREAEAINIARDAGVIISTDTYNARQQIEGKLTIRTDQAKFREMIIKHFKGRCCITGCTTLSTLDAAHIEPHNGFNSTVENGLLLRADLHRLMDSGLMTYSKNLRQIEIHQDAMKDYGQYHLLKI